MGKNNILLFLTIFLWGTVWYAIKFQLGEIPIIVSVFYRIFLAAIILLIWNYLIYKMPKFNIKDHIYFILMGFLLFSGNYYCFYVSTNYIKSGLVSIIFSTLVLINSLNKRIFLNEKINKAVVLGGSIGVGGVSLLFFSELKYSHNLSELWHGFLYAVLGTYMVSLGNIISARFSKQNMPVLTSTSLGLVYGAVLCSLFILYQDYSFRIPLTITYLSSLVYLSVFCTALAFWLYLTLVKNSGPDKAALATILFPLVAMLISSILEGYSWSLLSIFGGILIIIGYGISFIYKK
ncbi:DMT family transporter [Neisseria arctica]|uniref:DMT family transporter n=1 Tax=Neisseria arctica TaxID=1470200 RepID=UPI0006499969|nr:DMT family transporter [Neisseria arctica]UOO85697.1 DMT family transporter [Neisseria arctica]